MSARGKLIRFDGPTTERIEALAKKNRIDFASAARLAMKRGLAAYEQDEAVAASQIQRRRVLSPGIDP